MKIEKDTIVAIEYSLKDEDGLFIDSNEGYDPVEYLHGAGNIVVGLENGLLGYSQNDIVRLCLQPDEAYGMYKAELKFSLPLQGNQNFIDAEIGNTITLTDGREVIIAEKDNHNIVVDANHPLAGKCLHYTIKIIAIRAATAEEIHAGMPLREYQSQYCGIQGCYC